MISYWGVDHGVEISKRDYETNDRSDWFKTYVANRDMRGNDPRAKRNREIQNSKKALGIYGKTAGSHLGSGAALGAGIGALAARRSGIGAKTGARFGALTGAGAGAVTGSFHGSVRQRKYALSHPDYTKRGNKW
jgi:hypothetical protein